MADPDDEDAGGGAVDLFRAIGRQIKLLRERAGLTQRQLGEQLGYSEEQISSLERGRRVPQDDFLDAADELLGAGGLLSATKEDVARAKAKARVRHPAWFRDYARMERDAEELNFFSTLTIPGLLQTEAYARTIFTAWQPLLDDETIEQRVDARLSRQEILTRWPPPVVNAVIDESVLLRTIGGIEVQREQLAHLARLARLRNTTIQVLPLGCVGHAGMEGPFILLTPKGRQQVAYGEVQNVNRLITDLDEVRILTTKYGIIRAQALTPAESLLMIERVLGNT